MLQNKCSICLCYLIHKFGKKKYRLIFSTLKANFTWDVTRSCLVCGFLVRVYSQ